MSAPSERMRKRDKVFKLFRPASPDTKVNSQSGIPKDVKQNSIAETDTIQHHRLSTVSTNSSTTCTITESAQSNAEIEHVVTNTAIKGPVVKIKSSTLKTKLCLDVFKHNVNPPSAQVSLPEIYTRFDDTHQLALCIALLNKCGRDAAQQEDLLQGLHSDTTARLTWLQAVKQDPIEQDRIRC
ncbi:hypothetical protein EC991_003258 [Linnemannia zychae]|nr:hypothetical protein EC991_003258 [Linnemannia zychae]